MNILISMFSTGLGLLLRLSRVQITWSNWHFQIKSWSKWMYHSLGKWNSPVVWMNAQKKTLETHQAAQAHSWWVWPTYSYRREDTYLSWSGRTWLLVWPQHQHDTTAWGTEIHTTELSYSLNKCKKSFVLMIYFCEMSFHSIRPFACPTSIDGLNAPSLGGGFLQTL